MDYLEAVKKVQAKKPKDNYLVIEISYDSNLILPYKEGIVFLTSLVNAEQLRTPYGEKHRIVPIERTAIKSYIMSAEEYEQYKIAALLDLTMDEVKEIARKSA